MFILNLELRGYEGGTTDTICYFDKQEEVSLYVTELNALMKEMKSLCLTHNEEYKRFLIRYKKAQTKQHHLYKNFFINSFEEKNTYSDSKIFLDFKKQLEDERDKRRDSMWNREEKRLNEKYNVIGKYKAKFPEKEFFIDFFFKNCYELISEYSCDDYCFEQYEVKHISEISNV